MTVLDEIESLVVRRRGSPICDDCISNQMGFQNRQHANHKTRELSRRRGFRREKVACSVCGNSKLSISSAP